MKKLPFNLNDVGVVPSLFCRTCRVAITPSIHRAEDGSSQGFWVRHPDNDCEHSSAQTAMPIISLAELVLTVKK